MFTRNSIVLSNNINTPLTALSKAVGNILQLTYGQLVKQLFSNQEQGFAYDPNDLTDAKLNWRRNLLTWTEDFTNAAWGKIDVALVKDNIADPFGALGVFKLCPNRQTQPPSDCDIRQTLSKKSSGVFSVYLKKAERNFACINILGRNPTGSEGRLIVDLTTKAVNKLGTQRNYIIQEVGNGWLRVSLIFENFASLDVEVRVQVAENINSYATTGDGTRGIYAYAPQLEFFTDAPSTYQPITDFNSEFIKQFPLHALYQDAAGTIPVTAAGQPVGLMLDKSGRSNHAFQTVSASRPILRQTPILGAETVVNGNFSNGTANWTAAGGATLSVVASGIKVLNTTGGIAEQATQSIVSRVVKGATYSFTVTLSETSANSRILIETPLASLVNLQMSVAGTYTGIFTVPIDAADVSVRLRPSTATGNYGVFDDVTIKEITGYRTDQNYLQFDGVDDFLQTNNIDFTATDKVSLFAGVRRLSATSGLIIELGNDTTNNKFFLVNEYRFLARGNVVYASNQRAEKLVNVAPADAIVSAMGNVQASLNTIRINGEPGINSTAPLGSGVFINAPIYIGRRGGTSLPFNGHIYSLIGISRLTTDTETLALEKAIAKATGVMLNV